MTKQIRRNSLMITIPLVAVAAAWVFIVFLPIQKAIARIQQESDEKQQYCDRCQSLLPVLERSGHDLVNLEKMLSDRKGMTPSHREISSILAEITALANSNNIRTTHFDPEPILALDRIAQMPVSMTVTGSFPEIFAFLKQLESMKTCIWLERLEIEKTGNNGGLVSCELDMVIFMDNPENSNQTSDSHNR